MSKICALAKMEQIVKYRLPPGSHTIIKYMTDQTQCNNDIH